MNFGEMKAAKVSASDEWETDPDLIAAIVKEYGPIVLDCAANERNAKAPLFITKEMNGLAQDWNELARDAGPGINFWNPPFSKPNKPLFTQKAIEMARAPGARGNVGVLPANTRDRWFHELILTRVRFGRIVPDSLGGAGGWPALRLEGNSIEGLRTTVWLLEGQVVFGSPLNPKNNGCPGGVAIVAFSPTR